MQATPNAPAFSRSVILAMIGVNLMVLISTLDMSIVNVSLPTLAKSLHTDFATIQWVVLSYILVIACLLLLVSRLGDMKGKKIIFARGLILFTLGSLLCGLAQDVWQLILFRALQGVGAAMFQAVGMAIVTEISPPHMRGKAIGVIGGTVSVGLAMGPPLGGLLIDMAGWRFIFLLNVPIGIVAYLFVLKYLPPLPPKNPNQRFDPIGGAVAFLTLGSYSLGMTLGQNAGFEDATVLSLLAASVIGFLVFLLVEARAAQPMIDLSLFRNLRFSISLITAVLVFIALTGVFIMPFLLQLGQGYSVRQVGLLLMITPIFMGMVAPKAGALSDRYGSSVICIIGLVVMTIGCWLVSGLSLDTPWWEFALRIIPIGIGAGIFQAPNNSAIMGSVPVERLGVASGLLNYSRIFGQTTGLPLIGALFTALILQVADLPSRTDFSAAPPEALLYGLTGAYHFQALLLMGTTALAAIAWGIEKRNGKKRMPPAA